MKPRITVITIGIDDLEKSRSFYQNGLGFKTEALSDRNSSMTRWFFLI
ncbi:MAG: VOC family protein [Thiobacillaceae bacterium]